MFLVSSFGEYLEIERKIEKKIPQQIADGDILTLTSISESAETALLSGSLISVVMNIFLAASLKLVWKLLGAL